MRQASLLSSFLTRLYLFHHSIPSFGTFTTTSRNQERINIRTFASQKRPRFDTVLATERYSLPMSLTSIRFGNPLCVKNAYQSTSVKRMREREREGERVRV